MRWLGGGHLQASGRKREESEPYDSEHSSKETLYSECKRSCRSSPEGMLRRNMEQIQKGLEQK